jgi:hypothetical protein
MAVGEDGGKTRVIATTMLVARCNEAAQGAHFAVNVDDNWLEAT